MKKSGVPEGQTALVLRQVEAGTPIASVCRGARVSDATLHVWKKKYANLGVGELQRRQLLEDENVRLKRLLADLILDKHILNEMILTCSRIFGPLIPGGRPVLGFRTGCDAAG